MSDIAVVRTHLSMHEGSGKIKEYVEYAAANGIKSLIMADRVSMAGAVSFYSTCEQYGINPVMGAVFSVNDQEKVFSAQSARNGSFFALLEYYISIISGESINSEYISSRFTSIENTLITPLCKASIAKPKAISSLIKSALKFPFEVISLVSDSEAIKHATIHLSQAGALGAGNKKKCKSLSSKSLLGEHLLDHGLFKNYIVAFDVIKSLVESGDTGFSKSDLKAYYLSNKDNFLTSELTAELIFNSYSSYVSSLKPKSMADRTCFGFTELLIKRLTKKNPSNKSIKASLDALLDAFKSNCYELSTSDCSDYDFESCSDLERKLFGILNKTEVAECKFLDNILASKGSYRPFPVNSIFELTDFEFREIIAHVMYPMMLNAASNYKGKNERCYSDITLFSNTQEGYLNLKKLISISYMEGQSDDLIEKTKDKRSVASFPKLSVSRLRQFSEGLVAIVGLDNDELDKAIRYKSSVDDAVKYYQSIFDNVIVGVQRSTTILDGEYLQSVEANTNYELVETAKRNNLVAFALNNAFYLDETDYEVVDNKAAIILDEKVDSVSRVKRYFHGHYLKSPQQMTDVFSDLVPLINNMRALADYFSLDSHICLPLDQPELPEYPIPDGMTDVSYMKSLADTGLWEKFEYNATVYYKVDDLVRLDEFQKLELAKLKTVYIERFDYELDVIAEMGFSGYFLIVADFIEWAKKNGVPVGHGRGSGAGSIIAYGLDITDIDPIRYSLLFERFLNPERVSMPDFDIDFGAGFHPVTGEYMTRDSVISYVQDKYNNPDAIFPCVGQIATSGMLAAKGGVKKVGKVRRLLPSFTDQLAKLFPDAPEVKIGDCFDVPEVLIRTEREREVAELMSLTARLEGLKLNSGIHAGGVVIAKSEITDHSPIQLDIRDMGKVITQFDKTDVERAGLVKFDFLGLVYLTTMEHARKAIKLHSGVDVDLRRIPFDDPAVFDLLRSGNGHGVFQVESEGMRKLLRRLQCDDMDDLSALLALYRPAALQSGMVDNFIERKHGREDVSYPDIKWQHDCLKDILSPTYGIILYQEQVMQCAQVMAGYSLGGADLLRRAMGKKKPEEMALQRSVFAEGSVKNGIDEELSMKIFDIIEKFAGYGFNKSHSISYAHITYQTAYLKTHFPCEYMSALLTEQSSEPDKLKETLMDCRLNYIDILPPDINKSEAGFTPEGDMKIRYGLMAIKGIGEKKVASILAERIRGGVFTSVFNIRLRCGGFFDKKVSEGLLFAGALDSLELENEIPEGALRLLSEATSKQESSPKMNILKSSLVRRKADLEAILIQGKELREVIEGTLSFLGSRYNIRLEIEVNNSENLRKVVDFFLTELGARVDSTSNPEVVNDTGNLRRMYEKRNLLIERYSRERGEIKGLELAYKEACDLFLMSENLVKHDLVAMFDRRAYLLEDVHVYVEQLKVTDLSNNEKVSSAVGTINYSDVDRFPDEYRLKQEMNYLSYYVSGHPFDINNMRQTLAESFENTKISLLTYPAVETLSGDDRYDIIKSTKPSRVAGVIIDMRIVKIKKESRNFGREMALVKIDDCFGEMTVMLLPDIFGVVKTDLFVGAFLAVEGVVTYDEYRDDGSLTIMPDQLYDPVDVSNVIYSKPLTW